MPANTGHLGVSNELYWIGAARVLRDARVGVVHFTQFLIEHHVFQYGAKMERLKDIRLGIMRQIDRFGIATAFDIEDSAITPDMLIITN